MDANACSFSRSLIFGSELRANFTWNFYVTLLLLPHGKFSFVTVFLRVNVCDIIFLFSLLESEDVEERAVILPSPVERNLAQIVRDYVNI